MASSVQAEIKIFALPLGGHITPKWKDCPHNWHTTKLICIEQNSAQKDIANLSLYIPYRDQLPLWAANAEFRALIDEDGVLSELKIGPQTPNGPGRGISESQFPDIVKSISSRFGNPYKKFVSRESGADAEWKGPDFQIRASCFFHHCSVEFISAKSFEKKKRELDAQKARDAKRALTP